MMLTLDCISREPCFRSGLVREQYVTKPISINTSSVVTVRPAQGDWSLLKEINGKPVKDPQMTEVVYNVGNSVEKITVLGEYTSIIKKMSDTRRILNG